MPPLIHVEPEALRECSRLIQNQAAEAWDILQRLSGEPNRLDMNWRNERSAEEYVQALKKLLASLNAAAEDLHALGALMARQADRWEEQDQIWQRIYAELPDLPINER